MGLNRTRPINKAQRALTGLKSVWVKTINICFLPHALSLSLSLFSSDWKFRRALKTFRLSQLGCNSMDQKWASGFTSSFDLSFVCLFFLYWFLYTLCRRSSARACNSKTVPLRQTRRESLLLLLSFAYFFILGLNLLNPIFCYTHIVFLFFL